MPETARSGRGDGRTFKRDDNFDPWSCRLRCLQVGLPSGLVLLLDFGHCFDRLSYDDYRHGVRCPTPYDDILPLLGQLCASRRISKIGWSLGTEALILRRHLAGAFVGRATGCWLRRCFGPAWALKTSGGRKRG